MDLDDNRPMREATPTVGDDANIDLLIGDLVNAAQVPPKSRLVSIKPTVSSLTSLAYERGLLPDALGQLVDLITKPSYLDQASLASLVRNLYPAAGVSRPLLLRVLASLGHGTLKPSLNLQAALLRWLVMAFHVLEDRELLSQAYPVLFNLLDTAAIRPHLAHLLALVTRRKHVRPFRIQELLQLTRQTGNDPCLVGLLRVFKDYYPEIIVGEAVRGRASAFKHPDLLWRARLEEILQARLQEKDDDPIGPKDGFRIYRPPKRRKIVPTVLTTQATEDSVTLEEIDNVSAFVRNMDRLELPNQLVAVLADPLLQKLLMLRPEAESYQRVSNWLGAALRDLLDGEADSENIWEFMEVLRDFVVQSKMLPPVLLDFFSRFFEMWDGSGSRHLVYEILSFSPLIDFQELHDHLLGPLERAVQDEIDSRLELVGLYTNILRHWTALLLATDSSPFNASPSVMALIRHTGQLGLAALQISPSVLAEAAILSFYEQSTRLYGDERLMKYIRIEMPPTLLIYSLFFSTSLATVSRICQVLTCYKWNLEAALGTKTRSRDSRRVSSSTYDGALINLYNGYLMDICNCLWRSRAFSDMDANTQGCMVPRVTVSALTGYVASVDKAFNLASLFSLSHSPVFCMQSMQRVRELEDAAMDEGLTIHARHAGPATHNSLTRLSNSGGLRLSWQEYRIAVLDGLSARGFDGITALLVNTMMVVKKAMEGGAIAPGSSSQQEADKSSGVGN